MEWCWDSSQHIAIAVSGGVDSMVLLDRIRKSGHYSTLSILHVNHGLRAQSEEEQQMIEDYAKKYDIRCFVSRIAPDYFTPNKSIQQEARDYRYQFFDRIMYEQQLEILLTAHHQDDQLETIIFRLLTKRFYTQRLSIANGVRKGYIICRPMLHMKKADILKYAVEHNVSYSEDSSNSSLKYARNAIRRELIPAIDSISQLSSEALLDVAAWHEEVLELIDDHVKMFRTAIRQTAAGYSWDRSQFNAEKQLVRRSILTQLIEEAAGEHVAVPLSYLDEMLRIAKSHTTQVSFSVTSEWRLDIAYDQLMLQCEQPLDEYMEIQSPGKYKFNEYEIDLSSDYNEIIVVRLPSQHDKIKIGKHHQKINRIMINHKVPAAARNRLPIIEIQGTIAAVGTLKRNDHPIHEILTIKGEEQNA
ncbi:tRNA lysidine(34) synthetase TilS [Macrococcus lamae]|uniref:tRNA(Ile)-lysidine synthase n=1 Tax=Macrococcus lamae TaxID=198484 RepID=A0A4R6BSN5_9STAP|nr:tRNA lysidine(34) synthetase TilS [Macrococcus lamae]TDM07233.1 tRNA lysidine(34) synthetase TilS [Macrococcus lamae]